MFSSLQGEGQLIGKRQIFIRFAGCNIDCNYCDTQNSKTTENATNYTIDELNTEIQTLMSSDFDSLEITGGEPLLHADYIYEFLKKYPYKSMLETNATLPDKLEKLTEVIDIVSMDVKLPEYFDSYENWRKLYLKELESIKVLEDTNTKYYIKIVVSPTTKKQDIVDIMEDISKVASANTEIIIQPVSPMSLWEDKTKLFEISEIVGTNFNVSIIPQIHKYMNIE
nr:7-carboxy-7-deazaguanine synthase QueE [Methanosphaera cuniculi]